MAKHEKDNLADVEELIRMGSPCLAICAGKHCAKAGATLVVHAAQSALQATEIAVTYPVVLTRCQDHCDDAPALTLIPGAYPYLRLRPDTVRQVIAEHVRAGNPVLDLLPRRYRRKLERLQD
ncbi:MAG: (2Fe-2S) ferredoxin domain-containing protein [Oscillochloris sp.]|nr:(2Fe-2S) ferredoxin domain-containing protein [Oscillochloris sp.]